MARSYGKAIFSMIKWSIPFWIPISNKWEVLLLYILVSNWYCIWSFLQHFTGYLVIAHCFHLQFWNNRWCWVAFHILICHLYIFDEVSIQILFHLDIGLLISLLLVLRGFVYFLYLFSIRYIFCQYFCPLSGLFFFPSELYCRVDIKNVTGQVW